MHGAPGASGHRPAARASRTAWGAGSWPLEDRSTALNSAGSAGRRGVSGARSCLRHHHAANRSRICDRRSGAGSHTCRASRAFNLGCSRSAHRRCSRCGSCRARRFSGNSSACRGCRRSHHHRRFGNHRTGGRLARDRGRLRRNDDGRLSPGLRNNSARRCGRCGSGWSCGRRCGRGFGDQACGARACLGGGCRTDYGRTCCRGRRRCFRSFGLGLFARQNGLQGIARLGSAREVDAEAGLYGR